ncbi:phosphomevalonate kinase [Lentilactobacillus senioris]|uniref:phosphomevalonate kinase n=1 Tax=Lentilactobacillus senioris TaxID=931534 RepID=UPI00227FB55C|nr:phosphomevalonate kinase [Lentilactobacillus senioris]MCY9806841.1 phosphomevalonate kinase [Lentilactobacillus senioris]
MISAKAPGKLYIAGEYAVVETGNPAIIVALDQFVTVTIEKSERYGSIVSKQYQDSSVQWQRRGDEIVLDNRDNTFNYILSAIRLTEEYAQSMGCKMETYHLKVNSDLDSPDGKKYGLGSSAAVTVATINALCQFYKLPLTKDRLFKLAAIAHLDVQGNGSLGDIAASVYGGWIAYRSFDREWLKSARYEEKLTNLIDLKWPALEIRQLTPPNNLKLLIGWTGSPASTSRLVDKVAFKKGQQLKGYQNFLQASAQCLTDIVTGFETSNLKRIMAGISHNRQLLQKLSKLTQVDIETPLLTKMCNIAEHHHAAAKTSGAGGGDCGIMITDKTEVDDQLVSELQDNGVQLLPLAVHMVTDLD